MKNEIRNAFLAGLTIVALAFVGALIKPSTSEAQAPGGGFSLFGGPTLSFVGDTVYTYSTANVRGELVQTVSTNGSIPTDIVVTNPIVYASKPLRDGAAVQLTTLGFRDAYGKTNLVGSTTAGIGATNTITAVFQKSNDGVAWVADFTMTLTGTGTINASAISNVTANAAAFRRIFSVASAANGVGTNQQVLITTSTTQ